MTSLLQIVNIIETVSLAHKQVNSFLHAEKWHKNADSKEVYPQVFLQEPVQFTCDFQNNTYYNKEYFISLYVLTRYTREQRQDIQEDVKYQQIDICDHIASAIHQHLSINLHKCKGQSWEVSKAQIVTVENIFNDDLVGVLMDFSLKNGTARYVCEDVFDDIDLCSVMI